MIRIKCQLCTATGSLDGIYHFPRFLRINKGKNMMQYTESASIPPASEIALWVCISTNARLQQKKSAATSRRFLCPASGKSIADSVSSRS